MTLTSRVLELMDEQPTWWPALIAAKAKCSAALVRLTAKRYGRKLPRQPRRKWLRPVAIPKHAHPLVRRFYEIANEEQTTLSEICPRANLNVQSPSSWGHKHMPRIDTFDAALNVLDYELFIRRRPRRK